MALDSDAPYSSSHLNLIAPTYLTLTYVAAREVCSFHAQLLTSQNISDS